MSHGIKDYLHFSRGERNGIFVLLTLIGLVLLIKQYFVSREPEYFTPRKEISILQAKLDSLAHKEREKHHNSEKSRSKIEFKMTPFNPNDYTQKDWQALGLSEKQTQVVLNYKNKADSFSSKQQIKKLFVISDELYQHIEPYILLPDSIKKKRPLIKEKADRQQEEKTFQPYKKRELVKVNINTADTAQWKKLYGIGEVLSQRIVKRREDLGGFYAKNQLSEIWGIKPEVLDNLDSLLILDKITLRKININTATKEELKAHPYLYWKHANAIVNYRKQHGEYRELEGLKNVILITDTIYEKVYPYLEL